jgi:hypothetical protein
MKNYFNNKYLKKIPLKTLAIFVVVLLVFLVFKYLYRLNKQKKIREIKVETVIIDETPLDRKAYTDSRLNKKSSCFSCEQDMVNRSGEDMAWLGEPTRCVSCERDLIEQTGRLSAAFGT